MYPINRVNFTGTASKTSCAFADFPTTSEDGYQCRIKLLCLYTKGGDITPSTKWSPSELVCDVRLESIVPKDDDFTLTPEMYI